MITPYAIQELKTKGLIRFKIFLFFNFALLDYRIELYNNKNKSIEDWCKRVKPLDWICSAFYFKESNRGQFYWFKKHVKWVKIIERRGFDG